MVQHFEIIKSLLHLQYENETDHSSNIDIDSGFAGQVRCLQLWF